MTPKPCKMMRELKKFLRTIPPALDICSGAISLSFRLLFERLQNEENLSTSDLNSIAGTLQRLLSAFQELEEIRCRSEKILEKSEPVTDGLSDQLIQKLESRLQLL